jgi:VWFA-related protein
MLTAVSVAAAVLLARGQEPPQFRGGVELITVDVAVLDGDRQPVRGLTEADFTIRENGVVRPIRAFTSVDLGTRSRASEAVWAATVPPDVATNRSGEEEGRLLIVLMDRSIPVEQPSDVAKRIATAAIEALGPTDLGAVVTTGNGAIQNLTSDRTRLLRAINYREVSAGLSAEQEAVVAGFVTLDPRADGRCLCGLCVLETIERVADAVQYAPRRRKVLLFIGSSIIWQSARPIAEAAEDPGCETRLKDARAATFAAVDRANLTIHSIDPAGLVNTTLYRAGIGATGTDSGGSKARIQAMSRDTAGRMTSQQSLQVLPERTGGRAVVNRNDAFETVPAIVRESEAYYVLAFERGPSERPDAPRDLDVKVAKRGLRVVAQRRYVPPSGPAGSAAPGGAPMSADLALSGVLPVGRVPLTMSVIAFANAAGDKAIVRVNVDARTFARRDGSATPLDVTLKVVNQTGRQVAAVRQTSTIRSSAPGDATAEINVPTQVELPHGDYGIRVAVSDPATGAVASVFSDVTVPRFDNEALSLSGIAVETAGAGTTQGPTTRRVFKRDEQVRAGMQIYQGIRRTSAIAPVSVHVQILDAKGAAVRDQTLPLAADAFNARRADCLITLPLKNLQPGEYLLKLDATLDRQTTGRAVRFAVE